jgi:hypothetical protein
MVGFIGLGVEVGMWFQLKRDIQTAADSAAIAGAFDVASGSSTSATVLTAATTNATSNGYDASEDTLTAVNPPTTGSNTSDDDAVEVNISSPVNLLFAGMFLESSITVAARAVASTYTGGDEACVLSLSGSAAKSINASGGAAVTMDGCVMAANSTASNAISVSNNSSLTTECLTTAGGVDLDGTITYGADCSGATTGASQIDDPYSDLAIPAEAATCDTETDPDVDNDFTLDQNDTNGDGVVVFCSNISINDSTPLEFESDTVYVFKGADLSINGGSDVTGTNVTFIFTGSGSDWGSVSINGNSDVNLSAQGAGSGDYAGILFYQDGDTTSQANNNFTFNGGSDTELMGVVYVPQNKVTFNGGNEVDGNDCLQIVANEVAFGGNAIMSNVCDASSGVDPLYSEVYIKLIE